MGWPAFRVGFFDDLGKRLMILFVIRFLLATAFYMFITISNYYSVIAGIIFVAGFRSFLIFSPLIHKVFEKKDLLISLIISAIGVILYFSNFYIVGATLASLGLSVSGFIFKSIASETPSTSAMNKIAITSGNIGAGLILYAIDNQKHLVFLIITILLIIPCFINIESLRKKRISNLIMGSINNKLANMIWILFGIAIGIRVFGMYIIMPNYLISNLGALPSWYGIILVSYGLLVILTQIPSLGNKYSISLNASIIALGVSCIIMGLPSLFTIETFIGALIWSTCLAIEEVFAPYIDFHAAKSNHLLIKEVSIGIGGGICFLFTKVFSKVEYLSLISVILIICGYTLYQRCKANL